MHALDNNHWKDKDDVSTLNGTENLSNTSLEHSSSILLFLSFTTEVGNGSHIMIFISSICICTQVQNIYNWKNKEEYPASD